jgi:dTMP kinase
MTGGRFITLEGGEGVGKSTNIRFIEQLLQEQGKTIVVTREPGGTQLAEKLRQLLLATTGEYIDSTTELLLLFAARAHHINQVIKPALVKGHWVLCDRFSDSTYAYQGAGRQLNYDAIFWLETFVQQQLQADLTFLLDAPVKIGLARSKNRGTLDRFEAEDKEFHEHVRQGFLTRAYKFPHRIKVINATLPLSSVQKNIRQLLDSLK